MSLRLFVIALSGLELLACLGFAVVLFGNSSDPLGRDIALGVGALTALPVVVGTLPALIFGLLDRWLPVALVLALAVIPAWLLLMRNT